MNPVDADRDAGAGPGPDCLDEPALRRLLDTEVGLEAEADAEAARRRAGAHVDGCDACQRRLQALASHDSLEGDWHGAGIGRARVDPAEVDGFVRKLWQSLQAPSQAEQFRGAMGAVRVAVEATSRLGEPIGPYRIERLAGRGGMSLVYQATDTRLNRPVALKMLIDRLDDALATRRDRIEREAAVLARLSHPNLVPLFEVGTHQGAMYLVLEYIDGPTLAQWARGRTIDAAVAAEALRSLALAVQSAHEYGVIHRDLKPGNILLRPLASDATPPPGTSPPPLSAYRLMITDFGLARWRDDVTRLTLTGQPVGTPAYMAPEQVGGRDASIGPATDIYALGAVLYELLTGRPPLTASTTVGTLTLIAEAAPAPPRRLAASVPRDLETITLKCLEKDPQRRYATAAALADDLGRFLAHRPIAARPPGWIGRLGRWGQRNRGLAALGLVSLGLLLALTTVGVRAALNERVLQRESDRLRTLSADRARQVEASRDQARAHLERASQVLEQLGRQLSRLGGDADPAVLAARDQSFRDAVAFAGQHLAQAGPPETWSASDLRVALALVQMNRQLGRPGDSPPVLALADTAGAHLTGAHADDPDLVMPIAGGNYNEGLDQFRAQQPELAGARFEASVTLLDRFLEHHPGHPAALRLRPLAAWGLAQCLTACARPDAAARVLDASLAWFATHRADAPDLARDEATQATRLAELRLQLGTPPAAAHAATAALAALDCLPDSGPQAPERRRLQIEALNLRRQADQDHGDLTAAVADLEQLERLHADPTAQRLARLQQAELWRTLGQPERAASLARALASDPVAADALALPLARLLASLLAHQPPPAPAEADQLAQTAVRLLDASRARGRLDPAQAHQALTQDPAFASLRQRPDLQPLLDALQPARPR